MLQIDSSWKKTTIGAGMGWFLEGMHEGDEDANYGGATFGHAESALQAEATACIKGMQWAAHRIITSLTILSDSYLLVDMLREEDRVVVVVDDTRDSLQRQ